MAAVLEARPANPGAEKLSQGIKDVLYYLTDKAQDEATDPDGPLVTSASFRQIRRATGYNPRWVQRALARLEELGLISVTREMESGDFTQGHKTNVYTITRLA